MLDPKYLNRTVLIWKVHIGTQQSKASPQFKIRLSSENMNKKSKLKLYVNKYIQ